MTLAILIADLFGDDVFEDSEEGVVVLEEVGLW